MITKDIIKLVLASNQKDVERYRVVSRSLPSDDFPCLVFKGCPTRREVILVVPKDAREAGLWSWLDEMLYINFEDGRLTQFVSGFSLIQEAHAEMYGRWPMLFLDEVQTITGWEELPKVLPCRLRLVLTNDESSKMEDEYGTIEIMPVWKWLLS